MAAQGAQHRALAAGGYMIVSAIVALSFAYLPSVATSLLTALNVVPPHLM